MCMIVKLSYSSVIKIEMATKTLLKKRILHQTYCIQFLFCRFLVELSGDVANHASRSISKKLKKIFNKINKRIKVKGQCSLIAFQHMTSKARISKIKLPHSNTHSWSCHKGLLSLILLSAVCSKFPSKLL